jgi:hypothetical protein
MTTLIKTMIKSVIGKKKPIEDLISAQQQLFLQVVFFFSQKLSLVPLWSVVSEKY